MIVDGYRERAFGMILADAMAVQVLFDFCGLGHLMSRRRFLRFVMEFFVEDTFAQQHAMVANINARTGDQLFDFRMGFAAEAAKSDVRRTRHGGFMIYDLRFTELAIRGRVSRINGYSHKTR